MDPDQNEDDEMDPEMTETEETETGEPGTTVLGEARKLLPVHLAPTVGGKSKGGTTYAVKRSPGRPRKVERMPTTSDLEYHAHQADLKDRFVAEDPVVVATSRRNSDPVENLRLIRGEIAREAAALHFQRIENEKTGKDTSQNSTRRIDALLKVANLEMEIKKIGADAIDLRSERFQKVFASWIGVLKEAAAETLSPKDIDLFFNKLQTSLDGWEDRAEDGVRD